MLFFLFIAAIVLLVSAAMIARLTRSRHWLIRLPSMALPCLPIVWVYSNLYGPLDLVEPEALRDAYAFEFGHQPPPGVTDIQCRQLVVGDAGVAWMRFKATSKTLDGELLRFSPCDKMTFVDGSRGAIPAWWQPDADQVVTFYRCEKWSRNFEYSVAVLAHDSGKNTVYFCHGGFD